MPQNLISLQEAVNRIKSSIEGAIISGGTTAKNNLIRSQQPIKLLHEVVKSELIRQGVNEQFINPPLGESAGELKLAGFFKHKDQDICVVPNNVQKIPETLTTEGILYGKEDVFGKDFTEKTLSINVRSQLSSSAKNFDTLYERTFAEALNLHLRCPQMVLGEFYMIAVKEYDSNYANNNQVVYRGISSIQSHIQKYLLSFNAINGRMDTSSNHNKYERVCLLIVDFSRDIPKIYDTDEELRADGLLSDDSIASIENLSFPDFISDLLKIYTDRFGTGRFT
ncbi:hypothetical protein FACS189432_04680 [Bacteroidia bacterium]|nr:hypothetical protein FACS189426_22630 [Bacteroidia bacterium]GHT27724.1 hypothetical protein FACS189432_04680 [Bacteroidia bacterium]